MSGGGRPGAARFPRKAASLAAAAAMGAWLLAAGPAAAVAAVAGARGPRAPAAGATPVAAGAAGVADGWPVLIVALDGLDWRWLSRAAASGQAPHLQAWLGQAAVAVYNPLSAPRDAVGAYLTAATGVRVTSSGSVEVGSGPAAREVYRRRLGELPPQGALHLALNLHRLSAEARRQGSFAPFGWLGQALREAGVRAVVLGDPAWVAEREGPAGAHPAGSPLALASLLVMDRRGLVERVVPLAAPDPGSPGGLRTRWEEVPRALERTSGGCDGCGGKPGGVRWLAVVASGDLWRLSAEEPEMAPAAREHHHRRLARQLDRLVAWWQGEPFWGKGSMLLLGLAPGPAAREDGRLLTAWAWAGPWGPRGVVSPTTRRAGLVTGLDLAPTLASLAGAAVEPGAVGQPVAFSGMAASPSALESFSRQRAALWRDRLRVLWTLTTAQVLALGACLLGLLPAVRSAARLSLPSLRLPGNGGFSAFRLAAIWAVSVPLGLLVPWPALWPFPQGPGSLGVTAAAAALALAVAAGALAAGPRLGVSATAVVCGLTAVVLALDMAFGLDLVARSYMGYDLTAGARFYGIGNEHLGVFLGSLLVAAAEAGERWPRLAPTTSAALPVGLGLVAAPFLGANVGGAVACSVAFTAALMGWHGAGQSGRHAAGRVLAGIAVAAATVAAVGAWDMLAASRPSHLGRAVEAARAVGVEYVAEMAVRKVSLNLRLLRYSLYSRIMVVAMLAVIAAFWARAECLGPRFPASPRLRAAVEAAALGAAAALVANDSGVTAAAGALLGPAALVLELGLGAGQGPGGGGGPAGQEGFPPGPNRPWGGG